MFQRFTEYARQVVALSQREARSHHHDYVGTEHLLLAITHLGDGEAARSLAPLGASPEELRTQLEEIVGRGEQERQGHILFDRGAKKAFELSLRESLDLGHEHIGPEHILLGILGEGDGPAARLLAGLGADLARLRQHVLATNPTETHDD